MTERMPPAERAQRKAEAQWWWVARRSTGRASLLRVLTARCEVMRWSEDMDRWATDVDSMLLHCFEIVPVSERAKHSARIALPEDDA